MTGAARRLGLSASAMSRTLARLRSATGDPLLVRAGRGLVPTPYAAELRERVHALTRDVLRGPPPARQPSGHRLARTDLHHSSQRRVCRRRFPLPWSQLSPRLRRASACVSRPSPRRMRARFGRGRLIWRSACSAPSRRRFARSLCFETGLLGWLGSGIHFFRAQRSRPNDMRLAIMSLRHGKGNSPDQLTTRWKNLGSERTISVVVPGFPDAMRIARQSDLVALVPRSCLGNSLANDQGSDSRTSELRASGSHAGDRDFGDVASSGGRRPGTSLAS